MEPDAHHSCYTCHHFGERLGHHAWCETYRYVNAEPETGCVYWEREPGADDEGEPEPECKLVDWARLMRRNRRS
jgi:hypothetical protein